MELLEPEKRMIEFMRRMDIPPAEVVSHFGFQCNCEYCPLESTCSRIFGKEKERQCRLILECWINEIPFNLPVSRAINEKLRKAEFVKEEKRFYSFDGDDYSVFLTPNVKEWFLEISLSPTDRKPYAYAGSFQELMKVFHQNVEKQVEVTKEFVEDESRDIPYDTTMELLDNARKLREIYNELEQKFKKAGLIE